MKPTIKLASAETPDGGRLDLLRHDEEFFIMQRGNYIMSSRLHRSEEELAALGCEGLRARPGVRVLVGGLGMGYTLAAALSLLGPDAQVVVVELLEPVVRWNREFLAHLAGRPLDDPRVHVVQGDVAAEIAAGSGRFNAILLDVDNGPDSFIVAGNSSLYSADGLAACRDALRPGGVLAIWAVGPTPGFAARLRRARFDAREVPCQPRAARRSRPHVVWVARRDGPRRDGPRRDGSRGRQTADATTATAGPRRRPRRPGAPT